MPVEGINKIKKILADGSVEYRYYAWRGKGAPCFWVSPHKPVRKPLPRAFVDAFDNAKKKAEAGNNFAGFAARYLESDHYKSRAPATQSEYRRLVDKATTEFGATGLHIIADPRFRAEIIAFRDTLRATPREADNAVLAVSLVLGHAKNLGYLAVNPALGIPNLYDSVSDKRPWTAAQIQLFTEGNDDHPPADRQLLDAFWLIRHCGLRRKDAVERTRESDKDTHLAFITSKGKRKRRKAVIPLLPDGRAFLDDLYVRNGVLLSRLAEEYAKANRDVTLLQADANHMLLTSRGKRWTAERSISQAFLRRWEDLLGKEAALEAPTPHRLRNNYATALMKAEIDDRTIADAMGWAIEDVPEMRRIYVDLEAIVGATIIKLREAQKRG